MKPPDVELRELSGEADEMADLQRVLESAPAFNERVTGGPAGPADAQSTFTILPEGKGYDDKFVFGLHVDGAYVGCIDCIRGWPTPDTALVGLLLVVEPHQRRGIGRAAYARLEERIRAWGTCTRVRIAVVETNDDVVPFWRRLGFVPTGEVKPYVYGSVRSRTVVFERALDRGEDAA